MNTVTIEAHRFSTFWFWSCLIHALILLLPVRGWISYTPHVTAIELARVEMPILVQQEIKIPQRTPTSKPSMAHKPVASPSVKVVGRATQTIGVRKKDSTGTTLVHKPPVRRRRTAPLPPKVISPAPRSNRVAMVESASPLQLHKRSQGRSQHVMQMKPQAPDAPLQVSRDVEAHSVTTSSNAPSVTPAMVRERNASGVMHPRIERLITTERKMYGRSEVKWKQEDTSPIRLLHRKRRGGFSETGEQPQIDIERNHEIIIPSASDTSHRGSLIATRKERVGKVKPHPMLNELVGSLAHRAKGGRNKGKEITKAHASPQPYFTSSPKELSPPLTATPIAKGYTGLIIDARGLHLERSMSPRIYDERGNAVYGPQMVPPKFAIEKGVVYYYTSLNAALKDPRAGPKPLIVKAIGARGAVRKDIIVTVADGKRILKENAIGHFLDRCNVIFVID